MEFLHCNSCGYYPNRNGGGEKRRFFLTSCGHVMCTPCTQPDNASCGVCKSKCRTAEICASAKPEIKAFFMDPMERVKESFQQAGWMFTFQRSQIKSFSYHITKWDASRAKLEEENKRLKDEVAFLKQRAAQADQGVSNSWGQLPQMGSGFMGNSASQSFSPLFPPSISATPKPELTHRSIGNSDVSQSQSRCSSSAGTATGLRLNQFHMGPGRLTLPYTPIRSGSQRQFSPALSEDRPPSGTGSNFSTYGTPKSGTPDIAARLRQLQCQPKRPSPSAHFSQKKRQYY